MTSHVAENEWCVITHHRDEAVLELEWLPDGPEMNDGGFMASLSLLAIVAERVLPPAILIDATAFRHPLGDAVMEWRASSIVPRYGGARGPQVRARLARGSSADRQRGRRGERGVHHRMVREQGSRARLAGVTHARGRVFGRVQPRSGRFSPASSHGSAVPTAGGPSRRRQRIDRVCAIQPAAPTAAPIDARNGRIARFPCSDPPTIRM